MYFKAKFPYPIHDKQLLFDRTAISNHTGNETLYYNNYEFEIERDSQSNLESITFCNQCVNTFGIEAEFIKLLLEILPLDSSVKLYDSNGLTEILDRDELEEYAS